MKRFSIIALLIFIGTAGAAAQTKTKRVERIARQFAAAYEAKDLGRLDAARLIRGRVRIVIGYAYLDEKDAEPDTIRSFRSFKAVDRWLKTRADKGIDNPGRYVREFAGCRKGTCDFTDLKGSLHNQLYLEEFKYGYRNGRLYIKAIYLWNGD